MSARAQSPSPTPLPGASPSPSPGESPSQQPIWRCELPGGTYSVALRAVLAVSTHSYLLDGSVRVTEVNLDTSGTMAVRFYYIEPNVPSAPDGIGQTALDKATELARQVAGRTGQQDSLGRVVKSYPTTTHSHTIEYRLATREQLDTIFKSADNAFRSGRGATLKLP